MTDRNQRKMDYQINHNLNIDNYYMKDSYYNKVLKAQTYLDMNVNKIIHNKRKSYSNEDMFYGYLNQAKSDFYDFKYLSRVHEIKKLFHKNKEKLMRNEFFSEEIKACFANVKKKAYILIITFRTFYFLKKNESSKHSKCCAKHHGDDFPCKHFRPPHRRGFPSKHRGNQLFN